MILKSRKVAMYFGMALIIMLMPILPATITASTTNQVNETSTSAKTNEKTASYVEVAKYLVANSQIQDNNKERCLFSGKAVATTDPYIEVKAGPDETSDVVGKLFQYNIADILEQNDEWTKINSGNIIGFVKTSSLCYDEEAQTVAQVKASVTATINSDNTSVYANNSDDSQIIESYAAGTEVTPIEYVGNFIEIQLQDNSFAYIISENVSVNYGLQAGKTIAEEEAELQAIAAAKAAEEARIEAEKAAKAAEEAKRQQIIQHTKDGTDFTYNPTMQVSDNDIWLMACVIDWESGWESYEGKLAVANIILNRVRSSKYPNSVSGVVYAKYQFSGVADSSGNPTSSFSARLASGPRTQDCVKAALEAISGKNNVGGYTAFMAVWAANISSLSDYMIIGSHIFY